MTRRLTFHLARQPLVRPRVAAGRIGWPWLAGVVVWAGVGLSSAYWGLRWWEQRPTQAVPGEVGVPLEVDEVALARALGPEPGQSGEATEADATVAAPPTLLGVATDAQGRGVALLQAPGEPVRPVRVGAQLSNGWRLDKLERDQAVLLAPAGGQKVTLRVPARTP